jgi:hypothetical protein
MQPMGGADPGRTIGGPSALVDPSGKQGLTRRGSKFRRPHHPFASPLASGAVPGTPERAEWIGTPRDPAVTALGTRPAVARALGRRPRRRACRLLDDRQSVRHRLSSREQKSYPPNAARALRRAIAGWTTPDPAGIVPRQVIPGSLDLRGAE